MKLIIAGGRDYQMTEPDFSKLDAIDGISEVVSGGASGADAWGERWAESRDIPVTIFRADWKKYGKSAGPRRNLEMAQYAHALALFPGGNGTEDMFQNAQILRLKIHDFR